MDRRKKKQETPEELLLEAAGRRQRLTADTKRQMLAVLLRNRSAFETVFEHLQPAHLESLGGPFALLWRVVRKFWRDYQTLPGYDWLVPQLKQAVTRSSLVYQPEDLTEVDALLAYAYDQPAEVATNRIEARLAVDTACRLLEEELLTEARHLTLSDVDGTVPSDLAAVLRDQADRVAGVAALSQQDEEEGLLFTKGWEERQRPRCYPTGITTLDNFLDGGAFGGEVCALIGAMGVSKTLTTVQAVCLAAKRVAEMDVRGTTPLPGKRPLVFLVSTETPQKELQDRCLISLAGIPLATLNSVRSLAELSDSREPLDYERWLFAGVIAAGAFQSQRRRARDAARLINRYVRFVNFTGVDTSYRLAGGGGVSELARGVDAQLRRHPDCWPYVVWIDHADAWASRVAAVNSLDERDKIGILERIPLELRDLLALKYDIPVWVTHQTAAADTASGPTTRLHHSYAKGCKSFAEFCAFAVMTGTPDGDMLCKWECTKPRRTARKPPAVVRIDGKFGRVVDVTDRFTIDPGGHGFLRRDQLLTAAATPSTPPARPPGGPSGNGLGDGYNPVEP